MMPKTATARLFQRSALPAARSLLAGVVLVAAAAGCASAKSPLPGAEGFGALSRGGTGGRVLTVTSLDDSTAAPAQGTLRWAIGQKGPRIIKFAVAGNILLKDRLPITEPYVTIDGSDAPGQGICIRDHSLELRNTHDVIVRYIRIRRGDVETLKSLRQKGLRRPRGSEDLDTVSMQDSRNILFDHVSLSWSNDEILGIVRCQNVTIQWCILSEPLSSPNLHPYGDDHGFAMNASASTLTIHHCLFARYVMRGPQFEANDVRTFTPYDVQMEAVNNVMFDYRRSGSRYTTGIEDHPEQAIGRKFEFQFVNNYYLNPDDKRPEIQAVLKHGVVKSLRVYVSGNLGPRRPRKDLDEHVGLLTDKKQSLPQADAEVRAQIADQRLFASPVPVNVEDPVDAYQRVLEQAGCSHRRDAVDLQIIADVKARRFTRPIKSQDEVGGWPDLKAPGPR